jgi:hypothetical protein
MGVAEAQELRDRVMLVAQALQLDMGITQTAAVAAQVLWELLDMEPILKITAEMVEQGLCPQ